MHPRPEQFLLEKAVAMFLGEASTILRSNLWQGDARIEHHKPTHPRIALGAFGGFPLDLDHREVQLPVLLEMQVVPAADLHAASGGMLLAVHLISGPMGLGTLALKERAIFGPSSTLVPTHGDTVELAIAFEPDKHAVAQLMASTQELGRAVPAIRQDDDPPVAKERLEGLQLRYGHPNRRLRAFDALLIQNGGPTAGLLRHQDHRRKRPAVTSGFVDQGQIRQMDNRAIRAGAGIGSLHIAGIDGNPDGLVLGLLRKPHPDPEGAHLLDIETSIFQCFIHAGPLARHAKGDNDNSGNDCAWLSLEPRIAQIEQRIGSSWHTGIEKLPNVLQDVKIHGVQVLCLFFLQRTLRHEAVFGKPRLPFGFL